MLAFMFAFCLYAAVRGSGKETLGPGKEMTKDCANSGILIYYMSDFLLKILVSRCKCSS